MRQIFRYRILAAAAMAVTQAVATLAPDTSLHREGFFLGRYQRQLLDHVGHFPQREAPQAVAAAILDFCRSS